jgi:hypothetical protein
MNFCPFRFWVPFALGVALTVGPVRAQQKINFTRPVDPERIGQSNAWQTLTAGHLGAAGDYNAPKSLFGAGVTGPQYDVLPGSPVQTAVSPEAARQWQNVLDRKKNWMLLTPGEILGVTTPEKILGVAEARREENLSPEERFLRRLDREATMSTTNSRSRTEVFGRDDTKTDAARPADENNPFARTKTGLASLELARGVFFNPRPDTTPGESAGAVQKPAFLGDNPFGLPAPLPKQTPDQLAGMERFRALMEPSASGDKSPSSTRPLPTYTPLTSVSQSSAVNPAGHSYTPLTSNLGRPATVKPLPGVTGSAVTPPLKPVVQLPPWMQDASANNPVQRRF